MEDLQLIKFDQQLFDGTWKSGTPQGGGNFIDIVK